MHFETGRLIVRDFKGEDFNSLASFRADPDVARFMDFDVETREQAQRWFDEARQYNEERPRFSHHGAIILRDEGDLAGWVSVGHPESEENSVADRAFGYALGKPFCGKGIMAEAVRGMLRFCFEDWKVGSVCAQCSKANSASSKVLQKAGMQFVREFVSPRPKDGVSLLYIAQSAEWLSKYGEAAWKSKG